MFGTQNTSKNSDRLWAATTQKIESLGSVIASSTPLTSDLPLQSKSSSQPQSSGLLSANPNPNPYLTSAAIVPDFNGDGKTDKVWVDSTTGEIIIRLMDGTKVVEQGSLGNFDLSAYDYKIADFNNDAKTDFLLRNKTTGENSIVLMDGTKVGTADLS